MEYIADKLTAAREQLWQRPWQVLGLTALLFGIAVVHALAIEHGWYWEYRWLDIPMHFFGGVAVGWFVLLLFVGDLLPSRWSRLVAVLVGIFVIAILWEMFEYAAFVLFNVPLPSEYWPDTVLDMIMGTGGAVAAWIAAQRAHVQYTS